MTQRERRPNGTYAPGDLSTCTSLKAVTCRGCGSTFVSRRDSGTGPRSARHFKEFCSRSCRTETARRYRESKTEARRLARREAIEAAKVETTARRERARAEASAKTVDRICRICLRPFKRPLYSPGAWTICASVECRSAAAAEYRRRFRRLHGGGKTRHRVRSRGLPYEKRVGPVAVCERDGWRCQHCGRDTPRSLRGTTDEAAPEVDHIVPLSVPGSPGHVWSNVQCLCRGCNALKGSKLSVPVEPWLDRAEGSGT